jgi:hypothetical protein
MIPGPEPLGKGRSGAVKVALISPGSVQFGFGTPGDSFITAALARAGIALADYKVESLTCMISVAKSFVEQQKTPYALTCQTSAPA